MDLQEERASALLGSLLRLRRLLLLLQLLQFLLHHLFRLCLGELGVQEIDLQPHALGGTSGYSPNLRVRVSFVFSQLAGNCSHVIHSIDSYSYPCLPVGLSWSIPTFSRVDQSILSMSGIFQVLSSAAFSGP